jgi:hypothetical protein
MISVNFLVKLLFNRLRHRNFKADFKVAIMYDVQGSDTTMLP